MPSHGSFTSVRVLDLTDGIAEQTARMLRNLGADVVRVETGEPVRPPSERLHLHAGMRVVRTSTLADIDDLAESADVVVESGQFADIRGVGSTNDGLISRWPRAVHVVVTPFGLTGPRREWLATEAVVAATGGMTWLGGSPDGPPQPPPGEPASFLAAQHAAIAALLGVRLRQQGATGQLYDISAQEAVAATLEIGAVSWIADRKNPQRQGGVYSHVAARLFPTKDGWIAGGYAGSDRMWVDLLSWMGELGMAEDLLDPVWADPVHRWQNRAQVDATVGRFAAAFTSEELGKQARERRLPWGEVRPPSALLSNPHMDARQYWVTITGEDGTHYRDVGSGFASPAQPRPVTVRPPIDVPLAQAWSDERMTTQAAASPTQTPDSATALHGLRVLDLTWVLAGPYATRLLGEHGADVIKIESMHRGDPTRFSPGMRLRPGATFDDGAYFLNVNRDKRSVAVNLRTPEGVRLVRDLALQADIVIANFAPGVLERWGLDYASLQEQRPDIIVVSMSGLGQTGPWRSAVTFADTLSALSGMTSLTSGPAGEPLGVAFGLGDIVAANGAVLAILDRLRIGIGGEVDLSQLEAFSELIGPRVLEAQIGESELPGPLDRTARNGRFVPQGVYPGAGTDRWIAMAVTDQRMWERLVALVPGLASYGGATEQRRREAEREIDSLIAAWTALRTVESAVSLLQEAKIAAGVVATGEDLVERDPHLADRTFYQRLRHPTAGDVLHEGIVTRPGGTPLLPRVPAPLLGQHTEEVLHELLGISRDEIARLSAEGILE